MRHRSRFAAICAAVALAAPIVMLAGTAAHAPAGASAPQYGTNRWALIIGIDHYKKPTHPTVGGVGDSNVMYDVLVHSGWPSDHIMLLQESAATQANIRAGFQWLIDHSDDNSYSVFLYSGHVKQMSGDRDHDGEKVDEWMWPWDNKFIADRELTNELVQVRGYLWADLAGCEAAGLDDGIAAPNRIVTAASGETEKGFEHPGWHESIFNGLMLDIGYRQHRADTTGSGHISIQEAFEYARAQAPQMTAKQRPSPQHPVMRGGNGEWWYIAVPPPPPPPPPPPEEQQSSTQSEPSQQCTLLCN